MQLYVRGEGVLIEPIGHLWAAFSQATGETSLLNDESASILEVLESGPRSSDGVCSSLAVDSGVDVASSYRLIEECWPRLIDAGLVYPLSLAEGSR
jgi:hypothetical protein